MCVERLGHLFVVNGITTAEKKCATLLSMIGDGTYKLLSSLLSPAYYLLTNRVTNPSMS